MSVGGTEVQKHLSCHAYRNGRLNRGYTVRGYPGQASPSSAFNHRKRGLTMQFHFFSVSSATRYAVHSASTSHQRSSCLPFAHFSFGSLRESPGFRGSLDTSWISVPEAPYRRHFGNTAAVWVVAAIAIQMFQFIVVVAKFAATQNFVD